MMGNAATGPHRMPIYEKAQIEGTIEGVMVRSEWVSGAVYRHARVTMSLNACHGGATVDSLKHVRKADR